MNEIDTLKNVVSALSTNLSQVQERLNKLEGKDQEVLNKDGIPVGMHIHSELDDLGKIELVVRQRNYQVLRIGENSILEGTKFNSLSAAAEAFSNVKRKSGWIFWRDENGRTLKELYKG